MVGHNIIMLEETERLRPCGVGHGWREGKKRPVGFRISD